MTLKNGLVVTKTDKPILSGWLSVILRMWVSALGGVAAPAELAAAMEAALAAPVSADLLRARAAAFSLDTVADQYLQLLVGERQPLL